MSESTILVSGAECIPDAKLNERLNRHEDRLKAEVARLQAEYMRIGEEYLDAQDAYSAFLMLRNKESELRQIVSEQQPAKEYLDQTEGSPQVEPEKGEALR